MYCPVRDPHKWYMYYTSYFLYSTVVQYNTAEENKTNVWNRRVPTRYHVSYQLGTTQTRTFLLFRTLVPRLGRAAHAPTDHFRTEWAAGAKNSPTKIRYHRNEKTTKKHDFTMTPPADVSNQILKVFYYPCNGSYYRLCNY